MVITTGDGNPIVVQPDIYRDTLVRYFGYANEVGEAFRPLIPKYLVHASYGVAISYALADCADKSYKEYTSKLPASVGGKSPAHRAARQAGDVFLWQMLASIAIPGMVINRITWGTSKLLKLSKVKGMPRKWGATIAGLASIPLIISPIDVLVDEAMDATYRKWK